jgi:hypothetical protein
MGSRASPGSVASSLVVEVELFGRFHAMLDDLVDVIHVVVVEYVVCALLEELLYLLLRADRRGRAVRSCVEQSLGEPELSHATRQ